MEDLKQCAVCRSKSLAVFDKTGHIKICKECGYKFTSPRIATTKEISDMDQKYEREFIKGFDPARAEHLYLRRVGLVRKYLSRGAILDVGAGPGTFLYFLKAAGNYQLHGTEVSQACVACAKNGLGVLLDQGILEAIRYPDASFDGVVLLHVFEHLPDPVVTLREIARILKPGGFVFIAVPNDSLLGRKGYLRYALQKFVGMRKKLMYPDYVKEGNWHLSHFTPSVLRKTLEVAGFSVKEATVDDAWGDIVKPWHKRGRLTLALLMNKIFGCILYDAQFFVGQKI